MEIVTIISVFVASLAVVFYSRKHRQKNSPVEKKEILSKYSGFISRVCEQHKAAKAEAIKQNALVIRTAPAKNAPVYTITEVSARTIIVWTWSDSGFGPRGKEWSFPEAYDQDKMFNEVTEDVFKYQNDIYQKHNQRMPLQVI